MAKPSIKKPSKSAEFNGWKYVLIFFAFFIYGNTMKFDFVLDDDLFVRNHPMVQQGISAIPSAFTQGSMPHFKGSNFQIYRPAVVSFFTLQNSVFGKKPAGYHFVNIVLYALVCLASYELIRKLFPKFHPLYALLGALLFLVHPVHTEVVANIKSQDELLAALGCLLSLRYALVYLDQPDRIRSLVVSLLAYLLALFSKESAVAFLIIFPLTAFLIRRKSLTDSIRFSLPFLAAALFFIGARFLALRGVEQSIETTVIENVLYGATSLSELTATKAVILFYFWKLLLWPDPLSWDYSFNQIPLSSWSEILPWASVIVYLLALLSSFLLRNRRPAISWGLLFFLLLIVPTSNIFFLNGTTFAERFLFLPSLGAILALVAFVAGFTKNGVEARPAMTEKSILLIMLICGLGWTASYSRNKDWKDNYTLFESGIRNAPNSSRVQMGFATELMNKSEKSMVQQERLDLIRQSQDGFKRALEIWPENAVAAYKLGLISYITGDTNSAAAYYKQSLQSRPDYVFSLVNLASIYAARQQFDSARVHLEKAFAVDSLNDMVLTNLTVVQYNRRAFDEVLKLGNIATRNGKSLPKVEELVRMAQSRGKEVSTIN
jgi:tetratricopeptide (TPR) repeat protein